ncbi:prepilin-type N-terminal cleavage/methylation domain-containing protein [Clostridium sp. AM58-1XD]|uniref:type II secretion system protein n=1 Tax=Clostridium sp. AM58-1XD TaxID=2292307 RepID=UPI000E4D9A0E|nr:prepilin-type N-terminal cleavage/methylation domain-containing protein [Clostridium sp. AM58-1XD]RGY98547.1 prepilin-type N-terminal cleavage/methylation domain-containing protein [Clostridium sp. AM58-1XD]
MWKDNKGMTLLELTIAVTVLAAVSVAGESVIRPKIEKNRMNRHIAEAQMVYEAITVYLDDATSRGTVDDFSLYEDLMMYPVGDEKNSLYEMLKGMCSDDIKIVRISLDRKKTKISAIVCRVGGYEVEIRDGRMDGCIKIKQS